jgi:hypothetical protein
LHLILPPNLDLFLLDLRNGPPLAVKGTSKKLRAHKVSNISAGNNGDGPLLPLAIPVEGNRHGSEPRADHGAHEAAKGLVEGGRDADDGLEGNGVGAADVEDGVDGEDGDVRGAEERVGGVGEEWGAEEDEEDVKDGRQDEGEDQRDDSGLGNIH